MALLVRKASAFDVAEALGDHGAGTPIDRRLFGLYARQMASGGAMTIRDEAGALVLIAGLYPCDGFAEAWFGPGPALRANIVAAIRAWRTIFEDTAREAAPLVVIAHVPLKSVAGHRLAPLFGFQPAGELPTPRGPVIVWRREFPAPPEEE